MPVPASASATDGERLRPFRCVSGPWGAWRAALLLAALPALAGAQQNVLLVVADDMGVDALATYGEQPAAPPTPTLDALAAAGVLFRNASGDPVCSPTRATLLTGHYGPQTGVGVSIPNDPVSENGPHVPGGPFLPALLPRHRAAAIGKWHLTNTLGGPQHPIQAGFELFRGAMGNLHGDYFGWQKAEADALSGDITHSSEYVTSENVDDALSAIEAFGEQPWFVYLAFHAPHKPWHVPPAHLHGLDVTDDSPTPDLYRAMVVSLDTELFRLFAGLRPAVLARTTVIFVGDNGTPPEATLPPFVPEHGKGSLFEGGVNVPLIVAGAGVAQPGREVAAPVNTVDLFATVLELLGEAPPPDTASVSLVPYLRNPSQRPLRAWTYSNTFTPNGFGPFVERRRAARDERFKLLLGEPATTPGEPWDVAFYDLLEDPFEQTNLWPALDARQHEAYEALLAVALDPEGADPRVLSAPPARPARGR